VLCPHAASPAPSPPPPLRCPGASILGAELPHAGGSQVEFYTLEYALALAPHPSTWPLAAAYLAWAPAHGRPALAALLRSLPLAPGQPWAARKAAEAADRQGLLRAAQGGRFCACRCRAGPRDQR
jgi:hypothetical protein